MTDLLARIFKGELGAKTVLAAAALLALVIANAAGWITSEQLGQYSKIAEGLGLIGLRDALTKLKG